MTHFHTVLHHRDSIEIKIAAGNAMGKSVSPYVFPGARWNGDFLNGACPGSRREATKAQHTFSAPTNKPYHPSIRYRSVRVIQIYRNTRKK